MEQGWDRTFALRAIEEYRRFVFLSVATGHVVCPSEQVDQVWHQHLTFTESYWDDLCGRILQRPLHHRPTKGGAEEQARHWNLYEQTRYSYRIWFGESPPVDLWPDPKQRFQNEQTQRISRRNYWVLPKPHHWLHSNELIAGGIAEWHHFRSHRQLRSVGLYGGLIAAAPVAAVWNPLDWQGPDFLQFYLLSLIAVAVFGTVFRLLFWPEESSVPNDLSHEEIACLNGNWRLAVNSALARMIAVGSITAAPTASVPRFSYTGHLPSDASRLESAICSSIPDSAPMTLPELQLSVKSTANEIESSLQKRGLQPPTGIYAVCSRSVPFLVTVALGVLGMTKLIVGLDRGRPVGYLAMLLVVTGILAMLFHHRPRTTRPVRIWMQKLRRQKNSLRRISDSDNVPSHDVALAAALFGAGVLSGTACQPLQTAWQRNQKAGGAGGCGAVGCGGADAGGGAGCGGGGGGCGGCGGGS